MTDWHEVKASAPASWARQEVCAAAAEPRTPTALSRILDRSMVAHDLSEDARLVSRASYERDGFLLVPHPVLPRSLLDDADAAMDSVLQGDYQTGVAPRAVGWRPGDDHRRIRKIDEAHYSDRRILDLFRCAELARWAARVTGADTRPGGFVQVYGTQLLVKPAGGAASGNIGLHQDIQYWRRQWLPGGQAFTITIALSDVDADGGAITFFRGTHRWAGGDAHGVLPAHGDGGGSTEGALGDFYSADVVGHRERLAAVAAERGQQCEEVAAVLPRGGICIHDCRTFHGSGPNTGSTTRRSFAVHCRTDQAVPVPGSDDYYVSRLDEPLVAPIIFRAAAAKM